ncbi:hypothetical protein ABTE31_19805, partial [Acinetobacter baumannii]
MNEKGSRLLVAARANSTRMLRLIDDLLDVEKLEAGLIELVKMPTNLPPLLNQAMDSVFMLANQKQINLVNNAASMTFIVNADPHR